MSAAWRFRNRVAITVRACWAISDQAVALYDPCRATPPTRSGSTPDSRTGRSTSGDFGPRAGGFLDSLSGEARRSQSDGLVRPRSCGSPCPFARNDSLAGVARPPSSTSTPANGDAGADPTSKFASTCSPRPRTTTRRFAFHEAYGRHGSVDVEARRRLIKLYEAAGRTGGHGRRVPAN